MRNRKKWLCALATALGCAVPVLSFGSEANENMLELRQSDLPPMMQQDSVTNVHWVQEPIQTPKAPLDTSVEQAPADTEKQGSVLDPNSTGQGFTACCNNCCDCAPPCSVIAMVESTFFWPQLHREFLRSGFTNTLGTQNILSTSQVGSADGSLMVGPRVTLGLMGQRWGVVTRYWNAQTWAAGFSPASNGNAATGVNSFDGFGAYTFDIEAVRRFCYCHWNMYSFLGARYASVNNDRSLFVQNTFGGDFLNANSFATQQFNGTGLTFGLFGLRPLFDCSPFKLYFANRYSILWGNSKAGAQTGATVIDNVGAFASVQSATASATANMFIAEVQLGIQWEAQLKCLPGRAFIRSGFEYQYWDANNAVSTGANSFAASTAGNSANALALADNLLFSLVGFNIGAGITY